MRKKRKSSILFVTDFVLLNLSIFLVYMLKIKSFTSKEVFSPFNIKVFVFSSIFLNLVFLLFFYLFHKKLSVIEKLEEYSTIFKGIFFGIVIIYFLSTFIKPSATIVSWKMLGTYWLLTYVFVMAGKWFVHLLQRRLYLKTDKIKNTIIIGTPKKAKDIIETINNFPYLGYNILTVISEEIECKKFIDNLDKLNSLIKKKQITEVIIALEKEESSRIKQLYEYLVKKKIMIYFYSDLYKLVTGKAKITSVAGLPLIKINPVIMSKEQQILKKTFDLVFSSLILIVLIPLFTFIGILIKTTSHGTIFFKQKRMKNPDEEYNIIKFRTMIMGAESKSGPVWAEEKDHRVTAIGKILRKYWIDEIPQFINVLKGEMSIVGPRPERLHFVKILEKEIPYYRRRFLVKPGITGWAQVKHKYDESINDVQNKVVFDFYYIQNYSLWLDFKIVFMTIYMMLFGKGH